MESVQHAFPRAFQAAQAVDPLILASALDHIAKTARASRSQTRRIRWIEQRALVALRGEEFRAIDVELPKSAGPDTPEKLQRRLAYHCAIKRELREAAEAAMNCISELSPTQARAEVLQMLSAAVEKALASDGAGESA